MKRVALGVGIGIALLAILIALKFYNDVLRPMIGRERTLASGLAVTPEWTEIDIVPPVKPKYRHQGIYLRPRGFSFERRQKGLEIRLSDDRIVEPELVLVASDGKGISLHHRGFTLRSTDYAHFAPGESLPRDEAYKKLRIKSNIPFSCSEIRWVDYDPK